MADLTDAERKQITDYLSHPILFPADFKNWVSDYVGMNIPKISVNQIFGFELWSVKSADPVESSITLSNSASYASSGGPTLTGLANGFYIVLWGGNVGSFISGDHEAMLGLSVNGATPTVAAASDAGSFGMAALVDLTQGLGSNTLEVKYKLNSSTSRSVQERWLHALKVTTT